MNDRVFWNSKGLFTFRLLGRFFLIAVLRPVYFETIHWREDWLLARSCFFSAWRFYEVRFAAFDDGVGATCIAFRLSLLSNFTI